MSWLTAILKRSGMQAVVERYRQEREQRHAVTYAGAFSPLKMRAALLKGRLQFEMGRRLGRFAPAALRLFEGPTDALFRRLL